MNTGMTMLSNYEYTELIIKAHKYDLLREMAVSDRHYVTDKESSIYELTKDELKAIDERGKF